MATAAICLQRRLRARLRNVIGMREFDTVIMNEVVRIQRAYRLHRMERRSQAGVWSITLSTSRPRVAAPKNSIRREKGTTASRVALVVPSTPFDPRVWFEPPRCASATGATHAMPWKDEASSPRPATTAKIRIALRGAVGETYLCTSSEEEGGGLPGDQSAAYQLVSGSLTHRVPSVSQVVADPIYPANLTYARPLQKLKRRLAINNPRARMTIAVRARVLATRAQQSMQAQREGSLAGEAAPGSQR